MNKLLKYTLVQTMPIMLGYVFMGIAWGLMLQNAGFNFIWAFFIALFVYTGSGQFLMVTMMSGGWSLPSVFITQLLINSRHMFYGLSFLNRFKKMGKAYPYMIFSLTDETYSLLCYTRIPEGLDEKKTLFAIASLDQVYWVIGCTVGAALGELRLFDITGVGFAMTALFVVIFVEQWLSYKNHIPVFVGFGSGILSLIVFGPTNFILPALLVSVGLLLAFKKYIRIGDESDSAQEAEVASAVVSDSVSKSESVSTSATDSKSEFVSTSATVSKSEPASSSVPEAEPETAADSDSEKETSPQGTEKEGE